jgi:hypothetical protein
MLPGPDDGTAGRPALPPRPAARPCPGLSSGGTPAPAAVPSATAVPSAAPGAPLTAVRAGQHARLVIVRADGSRDTAWLVGHGPPDLGAIDVLARLLLVCRRQGDRLHLEDVSAALAGLLDLSGLRAQFEREPEPGEQPLRLQEGVDTGNSVP